MNNDKSKTRKISELGEFGLIEHITKDFKINHKNTIKGVGDDAAVMEKAGYKMHFFEGEAENLKITYPGDLLIASAILNSRKVAGSNP